MIDIGTHTVTLKAILVNQPLVPSVEISFSLTMLNPCVTTTLTLPTALTAMMIGALNGLSND